MKRRMGKSVIVVVAIMVLVGFYAFTLMTDFHQEFEEKELPEITYDVVAEKAETSFGVITADAAEDYGLADKVLVLGEELNAYVAKEGTFYPAETFKYYPVFRGTYVEAVVTASASADGNVYLGYSRLLTEEVSECYLNDKPYCFVIDRKAVWLVTEDEVRKVFVDDVEEKEYDVFDESKKDDPALVLQLVER